MAQVDIEVNGKPYVVGCEDGQEGRLKELAALFDRQMREVSGQVGQLGETRLMLMSALMLADELSEAQNRLAVVEAELGRQKTIQRTLELKCIAALDAAADKIEALP